MEEKWNNKIKTIKGFLRIALLLSILLGVFSIVKFIFIFYRASLSTSVNDWASFSSFTSGVVSPIFAILNILVLIFIAEVVNDWEGKREKLTQDRESKKMDYELKLKAIKDFSSFFEQFNSELENILENYTTSKRFGIGTKRLQFELLVDLYKHQFKSLSFAQSVEDSNRISTFIKNLSTTTLKKCFDESLNDNERKDVLDNLKSDTEDFYKSFYAILNRLKKELVAVYKDIKIS